MLSFVLNRVLKKGVVLYRVGIKVVFVLNRVKVSTPQRHPYTQTRVKYLPPGRRLGH